MYSEEVMKHFRNPKNMGEIRNPDGVGKVGNPACLIPNSMVHANADLTPIQSLHTGQSVLGHDGFFNKIERTIEREYLGQIITIKNKLGTTTMTPDHEVFAVKVPKRWKYNFAKNKRTLLADWHNAKELKKGDLAAYPVLLEKEATKFIKSSGDRKKYDFRSIKIPAKIKVDGDFLRLAGYYLAEGYLKDKVTKTYVDFAFNSDETNLAEDVGRICKKIFGVDAKIKTIAKRHMMHVTVNSVWVVRLFKNLFGVGANKKGIPHWMMLLPPEKQKSLLYGLWKGDGYFNAKKPRAGYSTISYALVQQIKTLLLRQKIVPSIYVESEKISKGIRHRSAYRIHIGERQSLKKLAIILGKKLVLDKKESTDSWFDDNFLYVPITSVKTSDYAGKVHNLEVENSKSYVTESLSVHNCGDLMWVYIKVGKRGAEEYLKEIKAKTFGCVAAISTSSMITELAKGKSLAEAEKISNQQIAKELRGLPPVKMHCSVLAADALKAAIEDYRSKKTEKQRG